MALEDVMSPSCIVLGILSEMRRRARIIVVDGSIFW
jgi:hypothetical protein